jgi:hypothetical protein
MVTNVQQISNHNWIAVPPAGKKLHEILSAILFIDFLHFRVGEGQKEEQLNQMLKCCDLLIERMCHIALHTYRIAYLSLMYFQTVFLFGRTK